MSEEGDLELDMHVFPTMGRQHVMRRSCWCGPVVDPETLDKTQYIGSIWVHRNEADVAAGTASPVADVHNVPVDEGDDRHGAPTWKTRAATRAGGRGMLPRMVSFQMVLSGALALITMLLGGWFGLFRYTIAAKEQDLERRLTDIKAKGAELEKLVVTAAHDVNELEKIIIEMRGNLQLLEQQHAQTHTSITEVKGNMVTTLVWEQRTSNLERSLNRVLDDIVNLVKQRGYPSSGGMPAVKR